MPHYRFYNPCGSVNHALQAWKMRDAQMLYRAFPDRIGKVVEVGDDGVEIDVTDYVAGRTNTALGTLGVEITDEGFRCRVFGQELAARTFASDCATATGEKHAFWRHAWGDWRVCSASVHPRPSAPGVTIYHPPFGYERAAEHDAQIASERRDLNSQLGV